MTELEKFINKWRPKVDQQLEQDLNQATLDEDLNAMMKYAVLNGGKRLRPLLTLAVVQSFGRTITADILKAASAVEWIHSYSLVHDDLPAMDNDTMRRGKPSVHALFGEANGILVGDALLTGAFAILSDSRSNEDVQTRLDLIQALSALAGGYGMVYGQVNDMRNHNNTDDNNADIGIDWLLSAVHRPKTAALLTYASEAGAMLAQQRSVQTHLRQFGDSFGVAYQIQDDIDDTAQASDTEAGTLPHIIGIEASRAQRDDYLQRAQQALQQIETDVATFDPALLNDFLNLIGD